MPDAAVTVRDIRKRFPRRGEPPLTVLDGADLEVEAGRIVAVLGPSGCGKSTLLNIVAGILPADGGEVRFGAVPAHAFREWSSIGYVFQEDRLLPWRTAQRNVEFSLEAGALRRAERRRRARRALGLVGLDGFERAWPHQLSGGMRSRVALARSLVLEPRILLMDEPFGRLDAQTRTTMHAELLKIWQLLGMSIVFVTHDVEESVVLADRVVVMTARPGRVSAVVPVPLPRPRTSTEPPVVRLIHELRGLVQAA